MGYAAFSSHEDFDGRRIVAHADDECGLIFDPDADPVPGLLPDDRWNECPFCIGGATFVPWTHHPTHIAEDADTRREFGQGGTGTGTIVRDLASEKQIAFIRRLLAERHLDGLGEKYAAALDAKLTRKGASAMIEDLLAIPIPAPETTDTVVGRWVKVDGAWFVRTPRSSLDEGDTITVRKANGDTADVTLGVMFDADNTTQTWNVAQKPATVPTLPLDAAQVPSGHYAIDSSGDNDTAFYRVDNITEGRWAGRTFVKMVVGGHPDMNVRPAAIPGILARIIDAGIETAAVRYGQEIGRCYRCNRTLTDEVSRELGIGPDCRTKE